MKNKPDNIHAFMIWLMWTLCVTFTLWLGLTGCTNNYKFTIDRVEIHDTVFATKVVYKASKKAQWKSDSLEAENIRKDGIISDTSKYKTWTK